MTEEKARSKKGALLGSWGLCRGTRTLKEGEEGPTLGPSISGLKTFRFRVWGLGFRPWGIEL